MNEEPKQTDWPAKEKPAPINIPLTGEQKFFLVNLQRRLILKHNQIMTLQKELPALAKAVQDGVQKISKECNMQPGFDFDEDLNIVKVPSVF